MPITKITLEPQSGGDRQDHILSYSIDFDQNFDRQKGQPIGNPTLNGLRISIERDSEPKSAFYLEWLLQSTKTGSVDICFYDKDVLKKTIKIEDAYLVSYDQSCSEPGSLQEVLEFSGGTVTIDDVKYNPKDY